MADVSQTPANVAMSGAGSKKEGTAGGTITAGMPVYVDANQNLQAADADDETMAKAIGIALNGASNGQPVDYCYRDTNLNVGGTLAVGQTYAVSTTAGGIAPESDLLAGDFVTPIGVGNASGNLTFDLTKAAFWHGPAHA
jgi:hypothetical protein